MTERVTSHAWAIVDEEAGEIRVIGKGIALIRPGDQVAMRDGRAIPRALLDQLPHGRPDPLAQRHGRHRVVRLARGLDPTAEDVSAMTKAEILAELDSIAPGHELSERDRKADLVAALEAARAGG